MTFLGILCLLVFCITLYSAVTLVLGMKNLQNLKNIVPLAEESLPRVSLVVPACNEQEKIQIAVESFLQQKYNNLEIIIINDRSTDRTGEIVEALKERHPFLQVHHITELPAGWLGKAHAMQYGAEKATGEYLIFTDADIIMEKTTISRAINHVVSEGLDHLSLIFKNIAEGWLLNSLILESGGGLLLLFRPWLVKNPHSRYFMGVGAFNLIKKDVYESVDGHGSFKMHPIDDIMLGKRVKTKGYKQDCLIGYDFVSLRWYESVAAMVDGLMKNVFAIINFRLLYLPGLLLAILIVSILPIWGLFLTNPPVQLICACTVFIRAALLLTGAHSLGISKLTVAGVFITPHITLYIVLRAVFLCLKNGGIVWRGTHYPLEELRKNEPLLP